jgi:hypothetical protein
MTESDKEHRRNKFERKQAHKRLEKKRMNHDRFRKTNRHFDSDDDSYEKFEKFRRR